MLLFYCPIISQLYGMGTFSYHIELKTPNSNGTQSLRVRITRDRLKAYLNLGLHVKKGEFNAKFDYRKDNYLTSKHPHYQTHNGEDGSIRLTLDALERLGKQLPHLTARQLKERYEQGEVKGGYLAFLEELRERFSRAGREAYAEQLRYAHQALAAYSSKTEDSDLLTPAFMAGLHSHLKGLRRKLSDAPKYAPKTLRVYFNALQNAYTQGIKEGKVENRGNPFAGLDLHVPPARQKRPEAGLFPQLLGVELEGNLLHARNAFVLCFLLHGARISEVVTLRWEHITPSHVSYLPAKKGSEWKTVPRTPAIDAILRQYPGKGYVLPFMPEGRHTDTELYYLKKDAKDLVNTCLKSLSRRLGIPKLTSHMARRSFADAALKVLDKHQVQQLGGWSSLAMVDRYARESEQAATDAASGMIFSGLFQGEQPGLFQGEQEGNTGAESGQTLPALGDLKGRKKRKGTV